MPSQGLLLSTGLVAAMCLSLAGLVEAACSGNNEGVLHLKSTNCTYTDFAADGQVVAAILPFCMIGFSVKPSSSITSSRVLLLTPLSKSIYKWTPPSAPLTTSSFDCSTASGRALVPPRVPIRIPGSKLHSDPPRPSNATVLLWNDVVQPSFMKATDPSTADTIVLITYNVARIRALDVTCKFVYKVTQGCVLGAEAASTKPITCPAGTIRKVGYNKTPYCEPCLRGSYSLPNAKRCTACPTESLLPSLPAAARPQCPSCVTSGTCSTTCSASEYKDPVKGCTKCPPGSYVTIENDACAKCDNGNRCCVVNPSAKCPACKKGAGKGSEFTAQLAAVGVKGAPWEKCEYSQVYMCNQLLNVTVGADCMVTVKRAADPATQGYLERLDAVPIPPKPASPTTQEAVQSCVTDAFGPLCASWGKLDFPKDLVAAVLAPFLRRSVNKAVVSGSYFELQLTGSTCVPRFYVPRTSAAGVAAGGCDRNSMECPQSCGAGRAWYPYLQGSKAGGGLCLPCPAGTYRPQGPSLACKKCPAGHAAFGVGNTACQACPAGTSAQGYACVACDSGSWNPAKSSQDCEQCPVGSQSVGSGCVTPDRTQPCCFVGSCGLLPACGNSTIQPDDGLVRAPALLRIETMSASCAKYAWVGCQKPGDLLLGRPDDNPTYYSLDPVTIRTKGPGCNSFVTVARSGLRQFSIDILPEEAGLQLWGTVGPAGSGSLGMLVAKIYASVFADPAGSKVVQPLPVCEVQLSLISSLRLSKPASSCPKGFYTKSYSGIKICEACRPGYVRKGGRCVKCMGATYYPSYGGLACKPCPKGTTGAAAGPNARCEPCPAGSAPNSKRVGCTVCPKDTYAPQGAPSCLPCDAQASTKGATGAAFCKF